MLSWATIVSFCLKHKTLIISGLIITVILIAFGITRLQLRSCQNKYDKLKKTHDATLVAQESCEKSVAVINDAVVTAKKDCAQQVEALKAAYEFGKEERDKNNKKIDSLFDKVKNGKDGKDGKDAVSSPNLFDYQDEVTQIYNDINGSWNAFAETYEGATQ